MLLVVLEMVLISGTGGDGKSFDISGSDVTYAGGGGGRGGSNAKPGGAGGGGAGGGTNPGTVNTGGGGGANRAAAGGNGGSGIVILKWSTASNNATRNASNYYSGSASLAGSTGFTLSSPAAGTNIYCTGRSIFCRYKMFCSWYK